MTIKQTQCLLAYLGYDPGEIDGLDGPKTQSALAAFRQAEGTESALLDAVANGRFYAGAETETAAPADEAAKSGTFWDNVKYFSRSEFRCPCGKCGGFPVEPTEDIVMEAERLREYLGRPVIIVPSDGHSGGSGVRCAAYNATLSGSAANSRHLQGRAADFSAPGAADEKIRAYLDSRKAAGKLHYWYQIASGSFHMDV